MLSKSTTFLLLCIISFDASFAQTNSSISPVNSAVLKKLSTLKPQSRAQHQPPANAAQQRVFGTPEGFKKFSTGLQRAIDRTTQAAATSLSGLPTARNKPNILPYVNARQIDTTNRVQTYIYLNTVAYTQVQQLKNLGVDIQLVNKSLKVVQGWATKNTLLSVEKLPFVKRVTSPSYSLSRKGSVTTAGDSLLRTSLLRNLGVDGSGVKVGIISDGANDWMDAQATGDLPADGISTYGSCLKEPEDIASCTPQRDCNEGTAIAEIIHDIAPGATIAVGAAGTSLEFIDRVNDLVNNFGADIIVDDLGYLSEPFFEDGPVAQAVAAVTDSVLFVSAAGNSALSHHESPYIDFDPGSELDNTHDFGRITGFTPSWNFPVYAEEFGLGVMFLQWTDQFGASSNDYNLYVDIYEADTLDYITTLSSEELQNGTQDPAETVGFCNPFPEPVFGLFYVDQVSAFDRRLELYAVTNGRSEIIDYVVPSGSVFGHPAVPDVIAVGAINADDPGLDTRAPYSSYGSSIYYPTIDFRSKPDLMAVDGVSVSGAGGFPQQFFGTSAAAPHVAGIAALMKEVEVDVTTQELRNAILSGTVDIPNFGTTGRGRIDAFETEENLDTDSDGLINRDDPDDDNDTLSDQIERFVGSSRLLLESDGDLIPDMTDNCPGVANLDQLDEDMNGVGDVCEIEDETCFPITASNGATTIICL